LLTKKAVVEIPLSIEWGNTDSEWVNVALNDYPGSMGEEKQ